MPHLVLLGDSRLRHKIAQIIVRAMLEPARRGEAVRVLAA
jgi:hypothetical protein